MAPQLGRIGSGLLFGGARRKRLGETWGGFLGSSCPTACTSRSTVPPNGTTALGSPRSKYRIHQMGIWSVEDRRIKRIIVMDICIQGQGTFLTARVKRSQRFTIPKWGYGASKIVRIKRIIVMDVCIQGQGTFLTARVKRSQRFTIPKWEYGASKIVRIKRIVVMDVCLQGLSNSLDEGP